MSLEARSLNSVCRLCQFLLEALQECTLSLLPVVAANSLHALPCRHMAPISDSVFAGPSSLCVCISVSKPSSPFFYKTPVIEFSICTIQYEFKLIVSAKTISK